MSEPLKACPFCGSTKAPRRTRAGLSNEPLWEVRCNPFRAGCNAAGPTDCTREGAIISWNYRGAPGEVKRFRAELRVLMAHLEPLAQRNLKRLNRGA